MVQAGLGKKARPYLQNNQTKRAEGMVQAVQHLLRKQEALSTNPVPPMYVCVCVCVCKLFLWVGRTKKQSHHVLHFSLLFICLLTHNVFGSSYTNQFSNSPTAKWMSYNLIRTPTTWNCPSTQRLKAPIASLRLSAALLTNQLFP
jgi:hypothetical protein